MPSDLVVRAEVKSPRLTLLLKKKMVAHIFEVEASVTLVLDGKPNVDTDQKDQQF